MQKEKNYYIVVPITEQNISEVYKFIESEKEKFKNKGDNNICLIKPNPNDNMFPSYEIEMKEAQLQEKWVTNKEKVLLKKETEKLESYQQTFEKLGSELYESSAAYLEVYKPKEIDFEALFAITQNEKLV